MATLPYFVLGPTAILSLFGLLHGPDKTEPTPAENWEDAVVDVVIPALNEEKSILMCLTSVANQTKPPRQIILVDDGSTDRTVALAEEFAQELGIPLIAIQRHTPIGKTPTLKRQARELDCDVEFILDADTVLESPNYIERTVRELYQGVGIASACGTILPMKETQRHTVFQRFCNYAISAKCTDLYIAKDQNIFQRLSRFITIAYRECLYKFLQRFIYNGEMVFFGTIINPIGCAVAYRRKYLKEVFDQYEPTMGDDLTQSEDIFIGFAMADNGYRNIQLYDVVARTEEPRVGTLPRQLFLWSSAFLQSCYYFGALVRSPLKSFRRWRYERLGKKLGVEEMRKIKEAYRQAFGREHTQRLGRPIGWFIFAALLEKVTYPFALLAMVIFGWWEVLLVTLGVESALFSLVTFGISKGERTSSFLKSVMVSVLRYGLLTVDLVAIIKFLFDLLAGEKKWRK